MNFPNAYEMVYWGDELRETMGLTAAALGAYIRIRIAYWDKMQRDIPFRDNDGELQRITGLMGANFARVKKELLPFFLFSDSLIINQCWEDKFIEANQKYERRKAAGIMSQMTRGNRKLQSPDDMKSPKPNDTENVKNQQLNSSNAKANLQQPESESEPDSYIKNIAKEEYNNRASGRSETLDRALKIYNSIAVQHGGVVCKVINPMKQAKLLRRVEDAKGIDMFETILSEAVQHSLFLQGKVSPSEGYKQFRLSIDFICQENSFNKIMNGNYNDQEPAGISHLPSQNRNYSNNKSGSFVEAIFNRLAS